MPLSLYSGPQNSRPFSQGPSSGPPGTTEQLEVAATAVEAASKIAKRMMNVLSLISVAVEVCLNAWMCSCARRVLSCSCAAVYYDYVCAKFCVEPVNAGWPASRASADLGRDSD